MSKKQTMRLSLITVAVLVVLLCLVGVFALNVSPIAARATNGDLIDENYSINITVDGSHINWAADKDTVADPLFKYGYGLDYATKVVIELYFQDTLCEDSAPTFSIEKYGEYDSWTPINTDPTDAGFYKVEVSWASAVRATFVFEIEPIEVAMTMAAGPFVYTGNSFDGIVTLGAGGEPSEYKDDFNVVMTWYDDGHTLMNAAPVNAGDYNFTVAFTLKEGSSKSLNNYVPEISSGSFNISQREVYITTYSELPYTGAADIKYDVALQGMEDPNFLATIAKPRFNETKTEYFDVGNTNDVSISMVADDRVNYILLNGDGGYEKNWQVTIEKANVPNSVLSFVGDFGPAFQYHESYYWAGGDDIFDRIGVATTSLPGHNAGGELALDSASWVIAKVNVISEHEDTEATPAWVALNTFDLPTMQIGETYTIRVDSLGNNCYKTNKIYFVFTVSKIRLYVVPSSAEVEYTGDVTAPTSWTYYRYTTAITVDSMVNFVNTTEGHVEVGEYYMSCEPNSEYANKDQYQFVLDDNAKYTIVAKTLTPSLTIANTTMTYGEIVDPSFAGVSSTDMGYHYEEMTMVPDTLPAQGITEKYYWRYSEELPADDEAWNLISWEEVTAGDYASAIHNVGYYQLKYDFICEGTEGGKINYKSAGPSIKTVTVSRATLTVKPTAGQSKTYGESDPTFTYTVSGSQYEDGVTMSDTYFSGKLARYYGENFVSGGYTYNVGTLALVSPYSDNYTISFSTEDDAITFMINKKELTVTADDVDDYVYGNTLPTYTATITGFVNEETTSVLSGEPAVTSEYALYGHVGTYDISVEIGTLAASNYSFAFEKGTLTVNKKPIAVDFTLNDGTSNVVYYSPTYDGKTYTISASATGVNDEVITFASTAAQKNVGSTYLTITAGDYKADGEETYANYTLAENATSQTLTIGIRNITVNVGGNTSVYGNAIATPSVTVISDQKEVQGETPWGTTAAFDALTSATTVANGSVTIFENKDTNYDITFSSGNTYSITARHIILTINEETLSLVYNGGYRSPTAEITGAVEADLLGETPGLSFGWTNTAVVGNYNGIKAFTIGGTLVANYVLDAVADVYTVNGTQGTLEAFAITRKPIDDFVTFSINRGETFSPTYDGNSYTVSAQAVVTGLEGEDQTITFAATLTRTNAGSETLTINAGNYKSDAEPNNGNYNFVLNANATQTLDIQKATYTINTSYYGEDNPFDGAVHTVTHSNDDLPEGVTASYYVATYENEEYGTTNTPYTGRTNVGTDYVEVRFSGDATNYKAIPSEFKTIKISQRAVTVTLAGDITAEALVYTGQQKHITGTYHTWANGSETQTTANAFLSYSYATAEEIKSKMTNVGQFMFTIIIQDTNYAVAGETNKRYFTITQAQDTALTTDIALASVTYTGSAQQLITTAGVAKYGATVLYRIGSTGDGTDDATAITATDKGDYDVYYMIEGTDNYVGTEWTKAGTATITQAQDTALTTDIALASVAYTGNAQQLITTAGAAKYGATVLYRIGSTGDGTDDATAITATDKGDYDVYYKIEGTTNYVGTEWAKAGTAKINAAAAEITKDPSGIANLVYTGEPIVLVTDGTADGGSFMYKVDSSAWLTVENVRATNAGKHTIVYKVVGDENHSDLEDPSYTFDVTIGKATAVITGVTGAENLVYNGFDQELLKTAGSTTFGTIQYKFSDEDDEDWRAATAIKACEADTYIINYRVVGADNYNGAVGSVEVTIEQKTIVVSATADGKTYDGTIAVTFSNIVAGGRIDQDDDEDLYVVIEGEFASAGAGENKTVTITKVELKGDCAGNYVLSTEEGVRNGSTLTANIAKKNIAGATITLDDKVLTYNGKEQTKDVVSVYVDELEVSPYIYDGNKATNAGEYTLTVEGAGNFTGTATKAWSIARAGITPYITLDNVPANGNDATTVYDGQAHTFAVVADGADETVEIFSATATNTFEGGYECEANTIVEDNYVIENAAKFTWAITARPITVTYEGSAKEMTYGDTATAWEELLGDMLENAAYLATEDEVANEEEEGIVSIVCLYFNTMANGTGTDYDFEDLYSAPAGIYYMIVEGDNTNYNVTADLGDEAYLQIRQAELTLGLSVSGKTYDGTAIVAPTLGHGIAVSGWKHDDTAELIGENNVMVMYAPVGDTESYEDVDDNDWSTVAPITAGDYYVSAAVCGLDNYDTAHEVKVVTIEKASLSVNYTYEGAFEYGTFAALSEGNGFTISGWKGEDDTKPLLTAETFTVTYCAKTKSDFFDQNQDTATEWSTTALTDAGIYYVRVYFKGLENYRNAAWGREYIITKKAITPALYVDGVAVNGNDATKVYDGQAHVFVVKALGAGSEIITLAEETITNAENVEVSFTAGNYAADDKDVENYVLAADAAFTYSITKKPIEEVIFKLDGAVKNSVEYDGQNHGVVAYATGVDGELFGIGGGAGKEAGSYTVTVAAGSYNDNYSLAEAVTFTWSIVEKAAVVDPDTGVATFEKDIPLADATSESGSDVTALFKKAAADTAEAKEIKVKVGEDTTIVFDAAAISQLSAATNVSMKVNVISDAAAISAAAKEALKSAEMIIEVSLGGVTFEAGKATVSVPFDKQAPKGMIGKVYYVDADGNKTDMNAKFEDGKVTFETNHFSDYIVVFEKAGGLGAGAIAGIVIGCVVGVAAIAVLIFFLLKKKKGGKAGPSETVASEAAAE